MADLDNWRVARGIFVAETDEQALWRNAMDLATNKVIPSVNARLGLTVAA